MALSASRSDRPSKDAGFKQRSWLKFAAKPPPAPLNHKPGSKGQHSGRIDLYH